jgi:hypothetical protein
VAFSPDLASYLLEILCVNGGAVMVGKTNCRTVNLLPGAAAPPGRVVAHGQLRPDGGQLRPISQHRDPQGLGTTATSAATRQWRPRSADLVLVLAATTSRR